MDLKDRKDEKFASMNASEFMAKLPSSAANGVMYVMLSFITVIIIWSIFATTNVITSAKGILVPQGDTQEVYSDQSGIAIELYVKSGDQVKAGDPLIKLDTKSDAETIAKIADLNQNNQLKSSELKVKKEQLKTNKNELERTIKIIKEQNQIKENKLGVAKNSLKRITQQYTIRKNMYDNELISKLDLLKEEDSLEKAQNGLREIELDIESFKIQSSQEKEQLETKIITTQLEVEKIQAQIINNNRQISILRLQSGDKDEEIYYDIIRAPIDGIISKSFLKHAQDYIQLGDIVFEIIPSNQPLIAKIEIPNTGIGRIKTGMEAKIKYDGYPYQQYGLGNGKIIYISPNSRVVDEQNQEFVFDALVSLDDYNLISKNGTFPLFTGLTLQAEIIIEEKQIIQFVLELFIGQ